MNTLLQLLRCGVCAARARCQRLRGEAADAPAGAPKCCAFRSRSPRPGSTRRRSRDLYSRTITRAHLRRALRLRLPRAAVEDQAVDGGGDARGVERLPHMDREAAPGHLLRRRPGVQRAQARGGRARLCVCAEALRRPGAKSPAWGGVEQVKFSGLAALRQQALDDEKAVRLCARRARRARARPLHPAAQDRRAAAALDRDARRAATCSARSRARSSSIYGDRIAEHPVGSGPFRLGQWRRSSLIVLERNPDYREMRYDAEPAADDAEGQALLAKFKGRRLPMVDRVEVSIIEEQQPRWLAFLNGQIDLVRGARRVRQHRDAGRQGRAQPRQAGIRGYRVVQPDTAITYFNMEHPVVGGYTPDKVALRRAIGLGDRHRPRDPVVRRGQAIPAHSPIPPHTIGYDPNFKSENGEHDERACEGAARPVRLCRPRRRRLARAARRRAAGAEIGDAARPDLAPVRRAVEEEHGRDRRPAALPRRQVARAVEAARATAS